MIDPLGPDPTDPVLPARQVAEIVSEFETPGPSSPLRPKVRYANYDSPEAQRLKEDPTRKPEPRSVRIMPHNEVPPRIQEVPAPSAEIISPASTPKSQPAPRPVSTALARPIPPKPSKLERAMSVAKTVLPLVGKMLPLLEGNVVGAASNLFANRQMQEVDLKPLEESISRLQSDHRALAFHSNEQKRAIQRLEDDFAALQESVQKHAADQAELIEHVAKLAKRTSSFMRLVTILLVVSILFTALLCVRIAYLIRF
jgi:hypothetical protein